MERGLRTRMHWTRWIRWDVDTCASCITDLVDTLLVLDFCAAKVKTFSFFFWSCYSNSLDMENTVTTPNYYFILKKYPLNKKNIFSLFS